MPLFSVIIPSYNHGQFLKQRIDSILAQTCQDLEIIILDDCSTDDSANIIEGYRDNPRVSRIHYAPRNSGSPFSLWQEGISYARGEYIWLAESDDYAHTEFLQTAASCFKAYPAAGMFYSNSLLVDEDGRELNDSTASLNNRRFFTNRWNSDYFVPGDAEINICLKYDCIPFNISSVVFKRELVAKCVEHVDRFRYIGDWFVMLQVLMSAAVCYASRPLNYYRRHHQSHYHRAKDIVQLKTEYYLVLERLNRWNGLRDKAVLLNYFAYNHLSFGLFQDGIITGGRILMSYIRHNWRLALSIMKRIMLIKIFYRRRKISVNLGEVIR